MIPTISPQQAAQSLVDNAGELIDVRTAFEFGQIHAQGARLVPLDEFDAAKLPAAPRPVYLICKSGQRAGKVCQHLLDAGRSNVWCVEGGTAAWEKAGLPVVRGAKRMSLERQVRIAAGLLVVTGLALGWFVHPAALLLSAFVGCGLVFAGITDWCGMALALAKMPWNRGSSCR